ncbi:HEAT repeat domain-containing protein [Streptomyces sp. ME02-8801-2C]|uniref:HEAT repeat domain-containing protein n=1 Tax=Streptomyces sp. ME02-8801-2C TaxID=3028680 RepID=UPI0029AA5551|nr:HEAT repeat domain-containing protein [Streptomyces sp. ME02-8801-2C]MDX3454230.1 HEAT repeat domain-containing protein [Streptomyces sp. ME02-8801-2C]
MADDALMVRADGVVAGRGYVGRERAAEVAAAVPESSTRILDWLRNLSGDGDGDWRRFERLAGVAVHLHPDGLAPILTSVLASGARGVTAEDLVDMLGELRAPEAVEAISSLVQGRKDSDGPMYALCVKGIQSLGEIGTPEANRFLKGIATSEPSAWPAPLRWHAAEELGIEDELGFDEDEMLGGYRQPGVTWRTEGLG